MTLGRDRGPVDAVSSASIALAGLAMVAFAANSVLARLALGDDNADPASFTLIRICSGAIVLALLASRSGNGSEGTGWLSAGSWISAVCLVGYAAGFSVAYVSLGAATGALVMFAVVQLVIFGVAVRSGERPGAATWFGLSLAALGLVFLAAPGLDAPDTMGLAVMAGAGLAWAAYTLRGRTVVRPLDVTASNFVRGVPLVVGLSAVTVLVTGDLGTLTSAGALEAVLSGAVASGLGYAVWYAVLPRLTRVQSGIIQLLPAPLAAIGGLLLIGEPVTARVLLSSLLILGGVALGLRPAAARARDN
jgi:drug/metabolite transporter (DMT)-like permease